VALKIIDEIDTIHPYHRQPTTTTTTTRILSKAYYTLFLLPHSHYDYHSVTWAKAMSVSFVCAFLSLSNATALFEPFDCKGGRGG